MLNNLTINQKLALFISLTFAIFLLIFFYWSQIRPTQIKAECQKKLSEKYSELSKDTKDYLFFTPAGQKFYDRSYQNCLHRKGL